MRELVIIAKCSDLCHTEYIVEGEIKIEREGSVPTIEGVSGGNYISIRIDLDEGTLIGYEPIDHEEIMDELSEDGWEEEEEEYEDANQVFEDGLDVNKNHPTVIDPKVLGSSIENLLEKTDAYKLGF